MHLEPKLRRGVERPMLVAPTTPAPRRTRYLLALGCVAFALTVAWWAMHRRAASRAASEARSAASAGAGTPRSSDVRGGSRPTQARRGPDLWRVHVAGTVFEAGTTRAVGG